VLPHRDFLVIEVSTLLHGLVHLRTWFVQLLYSDSGHYLLPADRFGKGDVSTQTHLKKVVDGYFTEAMDVSASVDNSAPSRRSRQHRTYLEGAGQTPQPRSHEGGSGPVVDALTFGRLPPSSPAQCHLHSTTSTTASTPTQPAVNVLPTFAVKHAETNTTYMVSQLCTSRCSMEVFAMYYK